MLVSTLQAYLNASQRVGSILDAADTAVNKTDEHLFPHEANNKWSECLTFASLTGESFIVL